MIRYSKGKNYNETSIYGSEFTALRIATEHIVELRNKLRTLGIPNMGSTHIYVRITLLYYQVQSLTIY
jgi:hypothetical protein